MSTSLPSRSIVTVDLPEVDIRSTEFVYNFFVPDESVSDKATYTVGHGTRKDLDADRAVMDTLTAKIPRYIRLDFAPVGRISDNAGQQSFFENPYEAESTLIRENFDKITYEHDLSGFRYTGIGFQDTSLDKKLYTLLSGALSTRLESLINPPVLKPKPQFKKNDLSLLEAASFLNDLTSDAVDEHFIADSMVNFDESGIIFINNRRRAKADIFKDIKQINIQVQLDNRVIFDVIQNLINDPMTIYTDELLPLLGNLRSIQLDAKSTIDENGSQIDVNSYDALINFVRLVRDTDTSFKHCRKIVGYVIDKTEVMPDGSTEKLASMIVENPNVNHAFDPNIRYGATYVYTIRTIANITFEATAINHSPQEDPTTYIVESLISSKPSKKSIVKCIENIPPPPPADFTVSWDFKRNHPRLTWNFPVNTQRDIKRFQIFRRESIKQSFELIRVYDFDNSARRIEGDETVDPVLVEYLEGPNVMFIDESFDLSKTYIYALCSIDAHGLSSNYSTQIAARYDGFKNKLITKLISVGGSPKALPNLQLDRDAFIDVVKTSGYDRLKVYFDPEYLQVYAHIKESQPPPPPSGYSAAHQLTAVPIFETDILKGKYRIQIINTDLQKQKNIDITIKDQRGL